MMYQTVSKCETTHKFNHLSDHSISIAWHFLAETLRALSKGEKLHILLIAARSKGALSETTGISTARPIKTHTSTIRHSDNFINNYRD